MTQTAFESFAEEGIDPGFVTLRQLPSKDGSAYVITDWTIAVKLHRECQNYKGDGVSCQEPQCW